MKHHIDIYRESVEEKDELRTIKDPSGIFFIDTLGQNEVVAIERFIEAKKKQLFLSILDNEIDRLHQENISLTSQMETEKLFKNDRSIELKEHNFIENRISYLKEQRNLIANNMKDLHLIGMFNDSIPIYAEIKEVDNKEQLEIIIKRISDYVLNIQDKT